MQDFLDFERELLELQRKIEELSAQGDKEGVRRLKRELKSARKKIFSNLSPWQKVQLARHPKRPYLTDYIERVFSDFIELCGDRLFSDDRAIIGGCARIGDHKVMVIGHQKGRSTAKNLKCNFGMSHPEGYRKAKRLMELGDRFKIPIITMIDTPGAYPGIGAEERGQALAIAESIYSAFDISVPIISVILGEGGSGGALAIGVSDRLLMLEHSIYSVASPEACAAILWKDSKRVEDASSSLRLTAKDLYNLKIVDEIVKEPEGGAHCDYDKIANSLKRAILRNLEELKGENNLIEKRKERFRRIGFFKELKNEDT
jgi:acetyl-CoA carboxylase carboxyl transferase subunit alpha